MKKYIPHILGAIFVLVIIGAWMLIAHMFKKPSETQVPFVVAHSYFVRNDVTEPIPVKIGSQDEFERYFGMAAFMGKDGQPTAIDFDKQFVLAIVLPVTDMSTQIMPLKVEAKGNRLFYYYEVKTGEQLSFSIQPVSIIILDKQYENHEVILNNDVQR